MTSRRKAVILVSCCLSLLIVSMDATIVNVAIPAIRADLHASPSQLQWVIDVYTLALASLLVLSGAMGDRFGAVQSGAQRRRADRRPIPSGHRRVDVESRCVVDYFAGVHRQGGACS